MKQTYRRPLSVRISETLLGWFLASLERQFDLVTGALALAIIGICIISAMIVIGNMPPVEMVVTR